jgi:DNA polymerase III gamma/tau subunit
VLLPSGSLVAKPALVGDKIELDRVAALEDARFSDPTNVDKALALADAYLRADHADWALATTTQFADAGDHRVHLARATAYAERLQAADSVAEAKRGYAACDREGAKCDAAARMRIGVVTAPMQVLVDSKIDPRHDPKGARDAVAGVLHSTKANGLVKDGAKNAAPKK